MPRPTNLPLLPSVAYENAMWWIKDGARWVKDLALPTEPGALHQQVMVERARIAADRRVERQSTVPYFSRYDGIDGWVEQKITTYAIDGIHPGNPAHRMFR